MQPDLFPRNDAAIQQQESLATIKDTPSPRQNRKNEVILNGARNAISRYSKLKATLDRDLLVNGKWSEVDSMTVSNNPCGLSYVDLFSGAGGISVGGNQAGFRKILSVDIDPDASNTIRRNFPASQHLEMPIEKVSSELLNKTLNGNKINVVFGGLPCQGFSVAGLRNPKDPRNQIFREYIRLVEQIKPDFVVMENVPGILSIDGGKVNNDIIRQFSEIGYPDMSIRILEAAAFGVPQLRTRAIFIANRHNLLNPYPREILTRTDYQSIESAIDDLKRVPRNGVPNHEWTRHSQKFEALIAQAPPGGSLYKTFRDAFKRQYKGVPSMAIKENHGGCHIHYELNRVLSAREMARLQTFPDDFVFSGRFKRVYWQVGNAVPCLMAYHIALAIRHQLELSGL